MPVKTSNEGGELRVATLRASKGRGAPEWTFTMISECVQCRARAPTVLVCRWSVLWPATSADGDFSRRLLWCDKVVQHKTKVGLEDEEDLDEVRELLPARGGSTAEPVGYCRGHDGGEKRKRVNGLPAGQLLLCDGVAREDANAKDE